MSGRSRRSSPSPRAPRTLLSGKCRCGAVRYEVSDEFLYAMNCHCSECRAATGSAFKAFAGIEREKLAITTGLDELAVFGEDDLNDTRCGACGSFLFSVVRDGAYVHVAMGSLVDAPAIRPTQAHLRRLQGSVVRDHRRPAAIRGALACDYSRAMRRVLVTGMSGTGKSTALAELGRRGFRVVDTDEPGWSEWVPASDAVRG